MHEKKYLKFKTKEFTKPGDSEQGHANLNYKHSFAYIYISS